MGYGALAAARYDGEPSHALTPGETVRWLAALRACVGGPAGRRVIDAGSGTGLLLDALRRAGVHARGIEPSAAMIAAARRRRPGLRRIPLHHGSTCDASTFRPASAAAFAAWRRWLRPGGALILTDGLWPATAWGARNLAAQPFAALRSPDSVAAALEKAGFEVRAARPWLSVAAGRPGVSRPNPVPRYVVVALKRQPSSCCGSAQAIR